MTIERVKYVTENSAAVEMTIDGEVYKEPLGDAMVLYGLAEWLSGGGVIEPYYTITSAEYNQPDNEAIISLNTVEAGRVTITEDKQYLWNIFQIWLDNGGTVMPFQDRNKAGREAAEAAAIQQKKRTDLLDEMIAKGIKVDDLKKLP